MLQVSIVGDRGSGKTTFLGLLYAAQVRSGSDRTDAFRFHTNYESLEEITVLFQRLMSGSFPNAATKEGIREIQFKVGFRKPKLGVLSLRRSRRWTDDAFTTLRFTLLKNLDEEVLRVVKGSSSGYGPLRDTLDGDVAVILVDSTKLAPKGEDATPRPMEKYDGHVELLLTAIQRWRQRGGRDTLHPIFVFSKFDLVKTEVLQAADIEATPPEAAKRGPRTAYAEALLKDNLPKTLAKVQGGHRERLQFAESRHVFSSVRTEAAAPGQGERIHLRRIDGAGWEPDYSRAEYLALLECLSDIANRTKG